MAPKSTPKRYKIKSMFKSGKIRLEDRLETVLGRSWPHLKVDFGHFLVEIVEPMKNPDFRQNVVPRRVLDLTWPDLGAQEGPKGRPEGIQEASKMRPK